MSKKHYSLLFTQNPLQFNQNGPTEVSFVSLYGSGFLIKPAISEQQG